MAKAKTTTKMCPVAVACDGASMAQNREMCARCAEKLKKREAAKGKEMQPIGGRAWSR